MMYKMPGIRYKITNIDWDTDDDAVEGLPTEVEMESDKSLSEMIDGEAAEWLADNYGCCVKSCSVESVPQKDGQRMFTVMIERVERYLLPVNVIAASKENAERKVEALDQSENEYCDYWNEMAPEVDTKYKASESAHPEYGEGPVR